MKFRFVTDPEQGIEVGQYLLTPKYLYTDSMGRSWVRIARDIPIWLTRPRYLVVVGYESDWPNEYPDDIHPHSVYWTAWGANRAVKKLTNEDLEREYVNVVFL